MDKKNLLDDTLLIVHVILMGWILIEYDRKSEVDMEKKDGKNKCKKDANVSGGRDVGLKRKHKKKNSDLSKVTSLNILGLKIFSPNPLKKVTSAVITSPLTKACSATT